MKRKRSAQALAATSTRELIVECWVELGRPPVDAGLLGEILKRLAEQFGKERAQSPASIARILADEGAELRHPEIIEFDAEWREGQLVTATDDMGGLDRSVSGERLTLGKAETLITKLEALRKQFETTDQNSSVSELRRVALEARQQAQAVSRSRVADAASRAEQMEIDEWLKVWLQTPTLFEDWLELRKRSDEFRQKFLTETRSGQT